MAITYEKIATTTLGSNQASVTFSSIGAGYTDIVAVLSVKAVGNTDAVVQFNNDSSTIYPFTTLRSNGSRATSDSYNNTNYGYTDLDGYVDASNFTSRVVHFMNYSNTTTHKSFLSRSSNPSTGQDLIINVWQSTAAIDTIKFLTTGQNYVTGSTFTIYGILKA